MASFTKRIEPTGTIRGFSEAQIFGSGSRDEYITVSHVKDNIHNGNVVGLCVTFSYREKLVELNAEVFDTAPLEYEEVKELTEAQDFFGIREFMFRVFAYRMMEIVEYVFNKGLHEGRKNIQKELRGLLEVAGRYEV